MADSHTTTKSGQRGTKLVRSTGLDQTSKKDLGTTLNPKMGGGHSDLSHSIKGNSVPRD
jgi:hypothetical protein